MKLKEEIQKRIRENSTNYETIGAEIKRHHLALSKTLQSIASDDCSVSYLCKIERNQVKPSPRYLREICKKVNISEDKMNYLLSSKDLVEEAVKIYYFKNDEEVINHLKSLEGLDNYRIEIVRLIFALTTNDISQASQSISKVWRLISSLADFDLMIFAGFYGVYKYLTKEYVEAADYLKLALDFNFAVPYFKPIILQNLFKVALTTGSKNVYKYYQLLVNEKNNYGENLNLDETNYAMATYYLVNEEESDFRQIKLKIANNIFNYNLDILWSVKHQEKLNADLNLAIISDMTRAFYLLTGDISNYLEELEKMSISAEVKILCKYLYYKKTDLDAAHDFLVEIAYPYVLWKNLFGLTEYFLSEVASEITRPTKYKKFYNMYVDMLDVKRIVEQI